MAHRSRQGFTIIEMAISLAIIISIAGFVTVSGFGARRDRQLAQQADVLVAAMRDVQQRSMSHIDSLEWGLQFRHLASGPDTVEVVNQSPPNPWFMSTITVTSSFRLTPGLEFFNLPINPTDIMFGYGTGAPYGPTLSVVIRKVGSTAPADRKTITLQPNGSINVQ